MTEIHPFEVRIPDEALADLHARLKATRWIDDIFVGDWRFGAPLPFVRSLCDYWLHAFDWRALEARINSQPNIKTEIDGITVHSVNRRSTKPDAVPLILIHGWPGSFLEFQDLWEQLAEPPSGEPAFHVVTPSLPGYGFSSTKPGMTPQRIAAVFAALMERLGYARYLIQGGDWGSLIGTEMARQFPDRVIGLHLNLVNGSPPPDKDRMALSPEEQSWIVDFGSWTMYPHFVLQTQKPASLAHALNDSPAGLAAWIGEKIHDWADQGDSAKSAISQEQLLANIALYWFTGTAGSSARLYYEMLHDPPTERYVSVPTAGAIFPKEVAKIPRKWAEQHYNIQQWSVYARGGHFPAMECPDILIRDIRRFTAALAAE